MCLAIPARIIELLDGDDCVVELDGVRKRISLALVEDAKLGDYVIVHVGYALSRLDPEDAEETLALFARAGDPLTADVAALAGGGRADLVPDSVPAGAPDFEQERPLTGRGQIGQGEQ